jgi:ribosomal protein L16 Arg81 hydroxylase
MWNPGHGLAELLGPVALQTFFAEHWEKRPLFIARGDGEFYRGLGSLADLDPLIGYTRPTAPRDLRLANAAARPVMGGTFKLLDRDNGDENDAPPATLLHDAYRDGQTVMINGVHNRWAPIAALCRSVTHATSCRVVANFFLTPPSSQGFTAHYDDHDTLILQLAGSKRWSLYRPVIDLPLAHNDVRRLLPGTDDQEGAGWGEPVEQPRLAAGDLLYLPRGVPHEAVTGEEASLHLTIGMVPFRWKDLLIEAVLACSEEDVRFRRALPRDWITGDTSADVMAQVQTLLEALAQSPRVARGQDHLAIRFTKQLRALPGDQFAELARLDDVTLATPVEVRPDLFVRVVRRDDAVWLVFPGNQVGIDAWAEPVARFIVSRRRFRPSDLPGDLDPLERTELVRHLIAHGLLRVAVEG